MRWHLGLQYGSIFILASLFGDSFVGPTVVASAPLPTVSPAAEPTTTFLWINFAAYTSLLMHILTT